MSGQRTFIGCIFTCVLIMTILSEVGRADIRSGLIAHYPFNGNATDATGNGHDGTVNGAALATDRYGMSTSAYEFDGIDDSITVLDAGALRLTSTDFTIAAWLREDTRSTSFHHAIVTRRGTCDQCGWFFSVFGLLVGPQYVGRAVLHI